jgi:hypothetical protein
MTSKMTLQNKVCVLFNDTGTVRLLVNNCVSQEIYSSHTPALIHFNVSYMNVLVCASYVTVLETMPAPQAEWGEQEVKVKKGCKRK